MNSSNSRIELGLNCISKVVCFFTCLYSPLCQKPAQNWYFMLLVMFVAHVDEGGCLQCQDSDFWYFDHHWYSSWVLFCGDVRSLLCIWPIGLASSSTSTLLAHISSCLCLHRHKFVPPTMLKSANWGLIGTAQFDTGLCL